MIASANRMNASVALPEATSQTCILHPRSMSASSVCAHVASQKCTPTASCTMGSGMTSTDSTARAWLAMSDSAAAGSEPDSEPELIAPTEGWRASSSRSGAPELTRSGR